MELEGKNIHLEGGITVVDMKKRGEEGGGSDGGDRKGIYLVWEDLTAVIPSFGEAPTKRLLNGLSGYAEPGKLMAIMGPSGSGKTTLLDSLAGRLSANVIMTGKVLFNGRKRRPNYGGVAYVTQEDALLGTLTVRETITYSAHLRLPCALTKNEINGIIDNTISEMGLQDCADNLIGNWHLRGISGGEKKRVSVALEILTQPQILFLDEPTSGLDSAAAFFVTQILRNIAYDGKTFFDEAGFPCPTRRNPSDHFLLCINTDFDDVNATLMGSQKIRGTNNSAIVMTMNMKTSEIKSKLIKKYQGSNYPTKTKDRIREISSIGGLVMMTRSGSEATWWKQLLVLTKRSFVNMSRDVGYYWLRIVIYIILSLCVGTIFFDVGTNQSAILSRGSCGGFISGFMIFMSIGGFPSFIEEMKIFYKERLKGHYGVGVFIISNFLSSLPFLVAMSLSTTIITYFMVKFHGGLSHFVYTYLDLISSIAVVESCMMVVASLVPNFIMGLIIGAAIIGVMMMTAGFFRFLPDLPKVFWRYPMSYINYMSWALQGEYKNDMIGLEFDPVSPGDPKLKGEYVINKILGIPLDHSKWWDLAIVIAILIAYRLLFFVILKFRERATPIFRTIYTKRTLDRLKKRASFRKTPPFRLEVVHSLSSQEGLNSPIH